MGTHQHPVLQERVIEKGDHSLALHKLRSNERQNKAGPKAKEERENKGVCRRKRVVTANGRPARGDGVELEGSGGLITIINVTESSSAQRGRDRTFRPKKGGYLL